jgi:biopolymer transport protein ExbB
MSRLPILFSGLLLFLSQVALAEDWSGSKKINLNPTAAGVELKGDLSHVPVLLRLHTGNFAHFLDMKEDGSDLRFFAADEETPLPYHVEKFDSLNELALIWVQAPKLAAKADFIWMKYGNPQAADAQDAKAVYDANFVAVYHFEAPGAPQDRTANANHAAQSTAGHVPAAIIGAGAGFNGAQKIVIPGAPSLKFNENGFTFSAWVKIAASQADAVLFARQDGTDGVSVRIDQTRVYARATRGGKNQDTPRTGELTPGNWHHVAVTGGPRLAVYVDGREVAALDSATPALAGDIVLGAAVAGGNFFSGEIDEVQISSIARSADWIRIAAKGEGLDARLAMPGEDAQSGGSTSYFGTILRAVTVDGWVVIVLLVVMAGVSWWVMVNKIALLRVILQDNRRFVQMFQKLSRDTSDREQEGKDNGDTAPLFESSLYRAHENYKNSPIYQIYHVGVQEVRHRLGRAETQDGILTPQAIEGVRVSLDAALVRESQDINKMLVFLTIAISGGPFLGLLGTVIGVMITFAAIAASGDVNINAIAPGIAAALVATVAGLLVAIPALFGYNYIVTQIKDVSADMQVFIDEFISRLAEAHADQGENRHESAGRKRAV